VRRLASDETSLGLASLSLRRERASGPVLLYSIVFLLVLGLVAAPLLFLLVNSFQLAQPGQPSRWGFDAWSETLANGAIWRAMWNSIRLYLATSVISWPTAITLAWILGRTDIPRRNWIEFLFWLSFFLPALTIVMGWITLIDPTTGLVNQAIHAMPPLEALIGRFNIYTFWGLVWVHLGQNAIALKTILLVPAFRNLDAAMEEASRLCGAGPFGTLRRVVIPLMGPAIIITALLGFVRLWQSFETEMVLGIPQGFYVYGTKIYDLLNAETPDYGEATVLAVLVIAITAPFMVLQQRFSVRRSYETITGRARFEPTRLGRAKWPVFAGVMGIALFTSLLPILAVTMATFMKVFGHFELAQPWTLAHWSQVLADPLFDQAILNTLFIAGGTAAGGVVLCTLVAYILVRTDFRPRNALDLLTWLPHALPGMLIGLGFLWVVLTWVKPLYGSLALLMLVTTISGMTVGVQIIKSNMIQLGSEMEEASRVAGGSWLYTMRRVVLPPLAPVLVLVGTLNFVSASRDVSNIILLSSGRSMTLALLQLDYMVAPYWESATVVAVVMTIISTGVALIARLCNLQIGMR
jgi:iron(III) transport system permease protein